MGSYLVGRQPIFDATRAVYGYELLYRTSPLGEQDGDTMTADVLVRAALDAGFASIVGEHDAFVNTTRSFLVGERPVPLPPNQTVLEVLDEVEHDEEVVAGCRDLVEQGYRIALGASALLRDDDPLLPLASVIKLDVQAHDESTLRSLIAKARTREVTLVAEKVETPEQHAFCQELGFDLFQGYLLCRPEVVSGRSITPNRLNCLRLIDALADPDISPDEIQRIVETDPALAYRFLRVAGEGAAGGMRRKVSSIRQGVMLLGLRRLRSWVMLMLLSDVHDGPTEHLVIALTRARMCELLAEHLDREQRDAAFTVGLVSALDLVLGAPIGEIAESLSLTDDVIDAITYEAGFLGEILTDARSWEIGAPDFELASGVAPTIAEQAYIDAVIWSSTLCTVTERATAETEAAAV